MNKHEAIYKLYPQVVAIIGDDAFDANGDGVQYDGAAVQSLIESEAYKAKRSAEYPSIVDQLDTLYHGGYDAWRASIQAVKDKYPKAQQ